MKIEFAFTKNRQLYLSIAMKARYKNDNIKTAFKPPKIVKKNPRFYLVPPFLAVIFKLERKREKNSIQFHL